MAADEFVAMPKPPRGYAACRVHDGEQKLLALGARRQVSHLVALDEKGSNGGRPTVCGLTRFDQRNEQYEVIRKADLPGWSMGGGVYGPGIEQVKCEPCWEAKHSASREAPVADIEDSARTLAEKHVEHYRSCGCLGDSAVCCDPRCECHDEAKDSASTGGPDDE